MDWDNAPDVKEDLKKILATVDFSYIDLERIFCYRTSGSKVRAYARTWAFPKIFQRALDVKPAYVIEVLTKHYDKLDEDEKKKVLIHELLHIPKNFSGALLPHRTRSRNLNSLANTLFKEYKKKQELKESNSLLQKAVIPNLIRDLLTNK
jgi:predicted metallopeptidase